MTVGWLGLRARASRRQRGFSLIELAVVLVIVGLLIGGGLTAFATATERTRRTDQMRQLERVREALYGFAMREGRLPCADITGDGVEDFPKPDCAPGADAGRLPWATLGVGRRDAWGYPLRYSVTANPPGGSSTDDYADELTDGSSFALDAIANRAVADGSGVNIAQQIPAVVVSFGPQGGQVWTASGYQCPGDGVPAEGFSPDETENCDGDNDFVDAGYRTQADAAGRFDDLIIWLPDTVLKARMVAARQLPRR